MRKKDRLIEIDNNYFIVEINKEKGFKFTPISEEDYLDKVVDGYSLEDPTIELAENNFFQQIIDSARESLSETLEQNIKKTVLSILGLEYDSWNEGHFKVDHCNSRMSDVTDLISEQLKDRLLKVELNQDFDLTPKEKAKLKGAMRKDFIEIYKRKIKEEVWWRAKQLASEHVSDYVGELVKSKTDNVAEAVLDQMLKKG